MDSLGHSSFPPKALGRQDDEGATPGTDPLIGTHVHGSQRPMVTHTVKTTTAGTDGVQSGRPIFDDFFQHLWPYIGNNTANVVFQMDKRLWLIRIDQ
ncbi:hypothetical protein TNCV_185591 [Trichonephila clavipes]|nr:hypothetical protein TNCV_185591 [Trichonephila clavipes]